MKAYNLLSQEDKEWLEENIELVEEGSIFSVYIKYAVVGVGWCHYRVVYVNMGGCMEYCYAERVVGTPKTTIEWEKAE